MNYTLNLHFEEIEVYSARRKDYFNDFDQMNEKRYIEKRSYYYSWTLNGEKENFAKIIALKRDTERVTRHNFVKF